MAGDEFGHGERGVGRGIGGVGREEVEGGVDLAHGRGKCAGVASDDGDGCRGAGEVGVAECVGDGVLEGGDVSAVDGGDGEGNGRAGWRNGVCRDLCFSGWKGRWEGQVRLGADAEDGGGLRARARGRVARGVVGCGLAIGVGEP